jgi:hypothetical protein
VCEDGYLFHFKKVEVREKGIGGGGRIGDKGTRGIKERKKGCRVEHTKTPACRRFFFLFFR